MIVRGLLARDHFEEIEFFAMATFALAGIFEPFKVIEELSSPELVCIGVEVSEQNVKLAKRILASADVAWGIQKRELISVPIPSKASDS